MTGASDTAAVSRFGAFRQRLDGWLDRDIPPRRTMFLFICAATFLVYFGNFFHFVRQLDMDVFSAPIAITFVSALFASIVVAAIFSSLGKTGLSVISGLLLFYATDLYVDWVWAAILAFLFGSALAMLRGVIVLHFLTVIFAITLLFALVKGNEPRPFLIESGELSGDQIDFPPIIHLILDEHGPATPEQMPAFSLWAGAYSRSPSTETSVPEMLGSYLNKAGQLGYRTEFWGNGHIDLCDKMQKCVVHNRGSMRGLMNSSLSSTDKAMLLAFAHLRSTNFIKSQIEKFTRKVEDFYPTTFNSALALSHLNQRVEHLGDGEMIIAHLLLPHYPYIYDTECKLKPLMQWGSSQDYIPVRERSAQYEQQRACMYDMLQPIIDTDAVVIMHGDHGTRIFPDGWAALRRSNSTALFEKAFRTLFALRVPGRDAELFEQNTSVSSLLEELVDSEFSDYPQGRSENVFVPLNKGEWIERQVDFRDRKAARDIKIISRDELDARLAK